MTPHLRTGINGPWNGRMYFSVRGGDVWADFHAGDFTKIVDVGITPGTHPVAATVREAFESAVAGLPHEAYEISTSGEAVDEYVFVTTKLLPANENACPVRVSALEDGGLLALGFGRYGRLELPRSLRGDVEFADYLDAAHAEVAEIARAAVGGKVREVLTCKKKRGNPDVSGTSECEVVLSEETIRTKSSFPFAERRAEKETLDYEPYV